MTDQPIVPAELPEPCAYMLKSGHGTHFKEKLSDEHKALMWADKPMWAPLIRLEDARAALAAAPQQGPMTEEQIRLLMKQLPMFFRDYEGGRQALTEFARSIEAHHGIKQQASDEGGGG